MISQTVSDCPWKTFEEVKCIGIDGDHSRSIQKEFGT